MCGIFFSCSPSTSELPSGELLRNLRVRGPDSLSIIERAVSHYRTTSGAHSTLEKLHLVFVSTVLALRGDGVVEQPLIDKASGSLLCWNGEAWKIGDERINGNDAQAVFRMLLSPTSMSSFGGAADSKERESSLSALKTFFRSLSGPFSFVFYDAIFQRIFYGRDPLGRRSLLMKKDLDERIVISSVSGDAPGETWDEVEADGIYMLDLASPELSSELNDFTLAHKLVGNMKTIFFSWSNMSCDIGSPFSFLKAGAGTPDLKQPSGFFPTINRTVPSTILLRLDHESRAVSELQHELHDSLYLRTNNIPIPPLTIPGRTRLAILFSGGLDCTLLARLIHEIIPHDQAIDLLNVAFENPRVVAAANVRLDGADNLSAYSTCPDRVTGLSSHCELFRICPSRTWRFVSINIPYIETCAHRSKIISLMHPHATEMDFSIACALYFASRGRGTIYDPDSGAQKPYTTPARVLFSGLGADELFGGYTRHATAYTRRGYNGLLDELELDFSRLGKRNLGRDDRVIAHWGREARYPYLDEKLVRWALKLPVWEKCGFGSDEAAGSGEKEEKMALEPGKLVLRLLALKLGMVGAAREKKRAIQFGARTAKMESGRSKGTQIVS